MGKATSTGGSTAGQPEAKGGEPHASGERPPAASKPERLLSAAAVALSWIAVVVLSWRLIDPQPALFQYIVSLFLYPIAGWVLGRGRTRDPLNAPPGRS